MPVTDWKIVWPGEDVLAFPAQAERLAGRAGELYPMPPGGLAELDPTDAESVYWFVVAEHAGADHEVIEWVDASAGRPWLIDPLALPTRPPEGDPVVLH